MTNHQLLVTLERLAGDIRLGAIVKPLAQELANRQPRRLDITSIVHSV